MYIGTNEQSDLGFRCVIQHEETGLVVFRSAYHTHLWQAEDMLERVANRVLKTGHNYLTLASWNVGGEGVGEVEFETHRSSASIASHSIRFHSDWAGIMQSGVKMIAENVYKEPEQFEMGKLVDVGYVSFYRDGVKFCEITLEAVKVVY